MNLINNKAVLMSLAAAAMALSAPTAAAQSEHAPRVANGRTLVGTWRVSVRLQDCQTQAPIGNTFYSLLTFHSDGTLGGDTMNASFQPGQRSSDFGTWTRTDWRSYTAIDQAFIRFSGGPLLAGVQTIRHKIALSEDGTQFNDEAAVQFTDFADNQVTPAPACAVATGRRLE